MSVNAKIAGYLCKADVSRGFFPEKMMKTVVRGDFTKEALDAIVAILTSKDLLQEQMEWGISRLPNITPEAASILIRSWFDGGKWKMEWEDRNLKNWIKVQLITKLGSEQEKRIANRILSPMPVRGITRRADLIDVARKIERNVADWELAKRLMNKVFIPPIIK